MEKVGQDGVLTRLNFPHSDFCSKNFYIGSFIAQNMRNELEAKSVNLPCPKCGKGTLKLSGLVKWQEDQKSKTFHGFREYECDSCGHKFKAHFVTLYEILSMG